jgi:hypothetical protein
MVYAGVPKVYNQQVWVAETATDIYMDTPEWFLWLQTAANFSYYLGRPTYYHLTLRKEKRRHDWYWYAYLKNEAKLHNAYAGRTPDLSTARLTLVAQKLADKVTQAQRAARLRGDTFVP